MLIRRVHPEDYAAVGELLVAAYAPSGMPVNDPYYDSLKDIAARDRVAEVWVACEEAEIVGAVTWCPPGSPLREIAREDEAEFRMMAVAPSAQGRGVGRALVEWVLTRAAADGFERVALSSAEWITTPETSPRRDRLHLGVHGDRHRGVLVHDAPLLP